MLTTCPACRINLAVTAADLRVGQGYVRCGRCDRVFNSLLTLTDDPEQEEHSAHAATGTASVPALDESDIAVPSLASPPSPDGDQARSALAELPQEADSGDSQPETVQSDSALQSPPEKPATYNVDVVESQATGTFETIILEGDGYSQTEEHVDETEVDAELLELARQIDARNAAPEEGANTDGISVVETSADSDPSPAVEPAPELDADEAVGNPRRSHWGWWSAASLLGLALAVQMVHHSRQTLVANATLGPPLQKVYALFGVELEPLWDLNAYDLRQLGGESQPGSSDRIVLRASVQNTSTNPQPPPLIRVVLRDRFGNALSTTDIPPADYLRRSPPSRMAPDQRLDGLLTLRDPSLQAAGFELDACLPGVDGKPHCSNDR